MKNARVDRLIALAKEHMIRSKDPIHDVAHVKRVVQHVKTLGIRSGLSSKQLEALQIAAWWHDVSRSITKRPSIMLMPFIDDLLSACMLWIATIRCGLFGSVAGMATRMIACKNVGTSRLFTRLFMRERNRIMVDLLQDADMLDSIHLSRTKELCRLAESSRIYLLGYRMTAWWYITKKKLTVRTTIAKKYLIDMFDRFVKWLQTPEMRAWHEYYFGKMWVKQIEKQILAHLKDLRYSS